jgi:hypothetical protein
MANERTIPKYVFEIQLFQRRLERTLRIEEDRVNKLLQQQIELIKSRKKLLLDLHRTVLERWNEELNAVAPASEETPNGE